MFHDDKMDISAYILIKLIGTACASWTEDIWQYNILFCILTVGKHGTDARIQEFSWGGGEGGEGSRSVWQKSSDNDFFSPQLILQKSNGQFQRNLSFFMAPDGVQLFPGGVQLLIPYRNPFNLWFSRGGGGGGGEGSRSVWQKSSDNDFFSPQLILQKSNGQFQRNLSFFMAPDGVQLFPGGVQLLIPYRNPFNLWFSRGGQDPLPPPPSGSALGAALTASWLRLQYIISFGLGKR